MEAGCSSLAVGAGFGSRGAAQPGVGVGRGVSTAGSGFGSAAGFGVGAAGSFAAVWRGFDLRSPSTFDEADAHSSASLVSTEDAKRSGSLAAASIASLIARSLSSLSLNFMAARPPPIASKPRTASSKVNFCQKPPRFSNGRRDRRLRRWLGRRLRRGLGRDDFGFHAVRIDGRRARDPARENRRLPRPWRHARGSRGRRRLAAHPACRVRFPSFSIPRLRSL